MANRRAEPVRRASDLSSRVDDARWWIQIGAEPDSGAFLTHLRERNFEILVIDPAGDTPGTAEATRVMTREPEDRESIRADVAAVLRSGTIAAVTSPSRDHATLRTLAALRREYDLPGLREDPVETLLSRSAWKKSLEDAGVETPFTAVLQSVVDLDRFFGAHPSARLSPASGGRGSTGVARARIGDPRNRELFEEARLASDTDLVRAEAYVVGDAYSIDGMVRNARFEMLHFGRKFSMRNLRGTLPTGTAWGAPRPGRRADTDPRWAPACALAETVVRALGLDDSFLSLDVIDDGDQLHVIDVGPQLGRGVARGLAATGVDIHSIACDLALGETTALPYDAGAVTTGFAQRLFYPHAQGLLRHAGEREKAPGEIDGGAESSSGDPAAGWREIALSGRAPRIVFDRPSGEQVERPRSAADRIATAIVEGDDQNAAWMRANEIDPLDLFEIEEPQPRATTVSPIWPIPSARG